MDAEFVNHYVVLGLPSGEEGAKLAEQDINKAYRSKAKELHPDKRRDDDPNNSHADFVKLQASYQILKNENARKIFDDHLLLRVKREKKFLHRRRQGRQQDDSERRRRKGKMMSDLEERERSCSNLQAFRARVEEEERAYQELLNVEIAKLIGAMHADKKRSAATTQHNSKQDQATATMGKDVGTGGRYDEAFEDSVLEKLTNAAQRQKVSTC